MKKKLLLLVILLSVNLIQAQQKAVTENGEEVILYNDGTWEYKDSEASEQLDEIIPTNPKKFVKDKNSTFLLKSKKLNVGFYLNPKKWSFKKGSNNSDAEYELELKGEDLYGMIISEKVSIPLETLKIIALENGRNAAPDLKIVKEEYRYVNGIKVLLLQMKGTLKGIKFTYFGYYYSNSNGTVQFITFTSTNLMDTYITEVEKLLNGIVELDK